MNRLILILVSLAMTTGDVLGQSKDALLFDSHSLMELTIPINFETLCRPSQSPDCDFTPTVIEYVDGAGIGHVIPISIRRRDGWRAQQTNCQIPTLFVRFSGLDTAGTPFEGQTDLALTSHCGKGISPENVRSPALPSEFERYVINEYLGYRMYNLISGVSLGARLVRVKYVNPVDSRLNITRDAFFTEHFDSLAKRFDAELLPPGSFDPDKLDIYSADQMALFQYMIGNTDWSIEKQENVVLLGFENGKQVPVAFDLDMSGMVNAHYAVPASGIPVKSVKDRYYMGYCHPDIDWDMLFAEFSGQEAGVMKLLIDTPGLGRGDRRMTGVFLDSFFDILDSEESRERSIINACQPWPPGS